MKIKTVQRFVALACCIVLVFCRVGGAEELGGAGVLAVATPKGEDNGIRLHGTAFLIDSDQGLFLTAAHVARASLNAQGASADRVLLRMRADLPNGGVERYWIKCEVLDVGWALKPTGAQLDQSGLSALRNPPQDDESDEYRLNDWALLKASSTVDISNLRWYRAIALPGFASAKSARARAQLNPKAFTLGFSDPAVGRDDSADAGDAVQLNFNLSPDLGDGLLRVTGDVRKGNSGGPCLLGSSSDSDRLELVGIVVKEERGPLGLVLPCYHFVDRLVTNYPKSQGVSGFLDAAERGEELVALLGRLRLLSAFERLMLMQSLCERPAVSPQLMANVIIGSFGTGGPADRIFAIARCKPGTTDYLLAFIVETRENVAEGNARARDEQVSVALRLGAALADTYQNDGDNSVFSHFGVDANDELVASAINSYALLIESSRVTNVVEPSLVAAIAASRLLDSSSPDLIEAEQFMANARLDVAVDESEEKLLREQLSRMAIETVLEMRAD